MEKRLALLSALTILVGCSARINSVIINRNTGTRSWDVDNVFLSRDIRVLDVKEEVKDGVLFVNILIKNGWSMPIGGKLKVQFYDRNGVQLDDPWGWHQLMLESNQEQWFRFMAPKKANEISKMKIMVRGINKYSS
ncbi:hypothetical protein CH330_08480 [candidate division WOR-3 bacterium JGI_Cruoil_03_51_56]|uniref:DUF1425 domain-containing protein n=1 Tax=candidate division WOR-3 bacterium JGI_Cruoil_03_51_56 TaxID=1973747 RepID=A0A235BQA9_UNCW3|nr:MAG: hypothetical protein CH330_08480 [candidate division WOR-3 bacterium JGI_Cruoil_03_51_56]